MDSDSTSAIPNNQIIVDNNSGTVVFNQGIIKEEQSFVDYSPSSVQPTMDATCSEQSQLAEDSLQSASKYFTCSEPVERNRTISDNEFFDHLAAGDTAMIPDENDGVNICDEMIRKSNGQQSSLSHVDSAAKLNVSENTEFVPERSILSEDIANYESVADLTLKSDDASQKLTKPEVPEPNISEDNDDREHPCDNKEDLPVFTYFSKEPNNIPDDAKTVFDDFSSVKNEPISEADAFSAAIEESELNRRKDAWIPSLSTIEYFSLHTNTSNISFTKPKLLFNQNLTDPIVEYMKSASLEEAVIAGRKKKLLTENSVAANENGLKRLMDMGCHRAAINLTARLIENTGENAIMSPQLLQLWFCRIGLLVKLKMFTEAHEESQAFAPSLDNPDLFFRFHQDMYSGREGSMASFGFRILIAEIPRYVGKYQEALGRLYNLLNIVKKIISNLEKGLGEDGTNVQISESNRKLSLELWNKRELMVIYTLVNAVSSHKDYLLAVQLMNKLIIKESDDKLPQLLSAKGRIYLQLGDIHGAQQSFNLASETIQKLEDSNQMKVLDLTNKAMMAMSQNNFLDAYNLYSSAAELDPKDAALKNNIAVCQLYNGQMRTALSKLELDLKNNPSDYLHEGILFNICTLYELESSHSTQKKINMLELISQHKGDSFNTACLKIT